MGFDIGPARDCPDCPRLAAFRAANRAAHPDWSNAPVASFGEADARFAIVGLAPGLRGVVVFRLFFEVILLVGHILPIL